MLSVVKFGGTSISNSDSFQKVADIVLSKDGNIIVVLSAMAGVTNRLSETLDLLQKITHNKRHESKNGSTTSIPAEF